MHAFSRHTLAACAAAFLLFQAPLAQSARAQPQPNTAHHRTPDNDADTAALNAELFYELLLGEMSAQRGDAQTGLALLLDAARRTQDAPLFQRATDIALQSRSAEAALMVVRAWKQTLPDSRVANRYLLRILVSINRLEDSAAPLQQELAAAPSDEARADLHSLPQLYARASDKALAAQVVERAIKTQLEHPELGSAAWTAIGRLRLAADNKPAALEAANNALANANPDPGAAMLAVQLLSEGVTQAQPLLNHYLAGNPQPAVRLSYVQWLLQNQRLASAQEQVNILTRQNPEVAEAWLIQATLQLQANQLDAAEAALERFSSLLQTMPASEQRQRVTTQTYVMQAQIAEKRGNYAQAHSWLARIDDTDQALLVQSRRAALLARQGQLKEARALIRATPTNDADEERLKLQAEAQLLRDARLYSQAYELQAQAAAMAPLDDDLSYDLAMLADKAGRRADMERLLRQIIARNPEHHHALNALGYSLADRSERLPEAKALIERALQLAPEDPFITDSLGWVEFRLGNKQQALALLQRAFASQQDPEIAAHMGEVLWVLGDRAQALATWRQGLASANGKDNDTLQSTMKRFGVKP